MESMSRSLESTPALCTRRFILSAERSRGHRLRSRRVAGTDESRRKRATRLFIAGLIRRRYRLHGQSLDRDGKNARKSRASAGESEDDMVRFFIGSPECASWVG